MITVELLKECRLEFEENFQSLTIDSLEKQLKVEDVRTHSLRVVNNSNLLAKVLLQSDEDRHVAEVIALFHDYGKAVMIVQGTESR